MRDQKPNSHIAKFVQDMNISGESAVGPKFDTDFGNTFMLRTISYDLGTFLFAGMVIEQYDDFSAIIEVYGKLDALEYFQMTSAGRKQTNNNFSKVEEDLFVCINTFLGGLDIIAFLLCAFNSLRL